MEPSPDSRNVIVSLVPPAVALAAVLLLAGNPRLAPNGLLGAPDLLAGYLLCGAVAALHRPWGGSTPGLGALVIPLAIVRLGALPAAVVAAGVAAGGAGLRVALRRRVASMLPRERWVGRAFEAAGIAALATLAAGAAWVLPGTPETAATDAASNGAAGALVTYGGVAAAALYAGELARRPRRPFPYRSRWTPLVLDAAGWGIGWALVAAAGAPAAALGFLVVCLSLLAAEGARQAAFAAAAERRAEDLSRVHRAHARLLAETSGQEAIAEQILIECENVLPVGWFQLELASGDGARRESWMAGPDGELRRGSPRPPGAPRALPGVHRRATWRVLEAPLVFEGERLAVLRVWCDPRRIEPGAEELVANLLPQMAASLHRARLDREAKHDALTGLAIRRLFDSRLQRTYRRACEEGGRLAVILCDIDHFKRINDRHGHAAGDAALVEVARALKREMRDDDLCCRHGGEEFALLLAAAGGEEALGLAERLRAAVAAVELDWEGMPVPLTMSSGVAAFPELTVKTAGELVLLADEALYEAKERGRDRSLLHLGQGRFRDAAGRIVRRRGAPQAPPPPRIFG